MTTSRLSFSFAFALAALTAIPLFAACAAPPEGEPAGATHDALEEGTFVARGTGYYPSSSSIEGGFKDRLGKKLYTLQQFLAGDAPYVSVAMDSRAFPYGKRLRIKEIEDKYDRAITFRVVDTGGAFRGKGRSRLDVCVANASASYDPAINRTLHVTILSDDADDDRDPTASDDPPASDDRPASDDPPASDAPASDPGGAACSSDGDCNPGSDGSGLICVAGRCTPGCTANWQCPGSTTCLDGQCR
jgi:3D (Asp-Asp-Asp) domain-containing protein